MILRVGIPSSLAMVAASLVGYGLAMTAVVVRGPLHRGIESR